MHATLPLLTATDFPPVRRSSLETLQVNLGCKCNQSCLHCHVAASPQRAEMMDGDTIALVLEALRTRRVGSLDLTGGAPELNVHFRDLMRQARAAGVRVIDRCNRTILSEPEHQDLADFLAEQGVEIAASLPCHSPATQVNYAGFAAERTALKAYLDSLSAVPPAAFAGWPRTERQAFVINAYNAFTVESILTRYPDLKSIKDQGSRIWAVCSAARGSRIGSRCWARRSRSTTSSTRCSARTATTTGH